MTSQNPFDAVVSGGQAPTDNPFEAIVGAPAAAPATPAPNPFEEAIKQGEQTRQRQQFMETLQKSKDVVPERQARAIEVARMRGVPVGVAYQYLDELAPPAQQPDYEALSQRAPHTASLVSDPVAGPVAFPDAQHLGDIEEKLKAFSQSRGLDKPAPTQPLIDQIFGAGSTFLTPEQQQAEQAKRIKDAAAAAADAEEAQRQADLIRQNEQAWREQNDPNFLYGGKNYNPASDLTRSTAAANTAQAEADLALQKSTPPTQSATMAKVNAVLRTLTGFGSSTLQGASAMADALDRVAPIGSPTLNKNGRSPTTDYLASFGDYWSQLFPEDKARANDLSLRATTAISSGVPFMAGGYAAKLMGISPGWFAGLAGGFQQAGQGEQDAIDHGASPATKDITTFLNFALGLTEAVPVEALFATAAAGRPGLMQYLSEIGSNAAIEAGQNVVQQVPADLLAKYTYDPKRDVLGNALEAAKMGGLAGGFFGAVAGLAGSVATQHHADLIALGDAAKKMKIGEIAPQILEQYVSNLKKSGAAPEHVTAPAPAVETLFQEMTPEDLQQFPKTLQSLQEARGTGVEVTIPTEELIRLGKLKGYTNFAADVRVGNEMTLNEETQLRKDVASYISDAATATAEPSTPQEDSPVYKGLRDQLLAAGQSNEVATAQARLFDAFFTAQSERTGIPAADIARRYHVDVNNSAIADTAGQTVLAQSDGFAKWFGDSKAVDEQGKPMVMYHGTKSSFDEFARIDGGNAYGDGFYFTKDPAKASDYATGENVNRISPEGNAGPNVMPVYLSAKKPFRARELLTRAEVNAIEKAANASEPGYFKKGELWKMFDRAYQPTGDNVVYHLPAGKDHSANDILRAAGYDSLDTPYGWVVFDPTQIKSVHNQGTFDPNNPNILLQKGGSEARGSITFSPLRDKFRITLTEKANLSTFLHEGGHFFLEVLQDIVNRGEASAQQVADLKTLKRWMGIEDGKAIDRNGHEKFARTFESYLMEGKAPSLALHGIFQKFKAWMIFVYKRLANVRGELNDEIRSVMDRLVASDAAIAEARTMVGWRGAPMSQEETGLTDAEYKSYVGEWMKANDAQAQDADARVMLEAARELKKTWTEERNKVTKQLEAELAATRGWKAWQLLEKGEGIEDYGRTEIKIDPETIPQGWRTDTKGMTAPAEQGGMHLDMVAELLGFETGEQMLQAIGGAKLARKAIPLRTKQIMAERHGEMDAAALAREAMKAVHNKPTMDVLLTEFRALAGKANLKVTDDVRRIIKASAEERVAQLTQRQLDPVKWRRAEVKAAEEAGKMAAKGRDVEAALAKRKQLMAAAMHKASLEAQDRISEIKDYLSTFVTNRRRAALGKAGDVYLDQVDQILEGIQLKEVTLKHITARKSMAEFIKEQEAAGEPVFISDQTREMLGRKNYSELTLEELEGVHDAVKNIWTIAKEVNTVRKAGEKIALETALADITREAEATLPAIKKRDHLNPTKIDKMAATISRYAGSLYKAEFIFDWLGKSAHSLLFQPIADAQFEAWKKHRDLTAPFMDKLRSMPKEQRQRWSTKRQFLNYPMPLKGSNIWMIALNLGNASNKEKLLAGYGWTESQVRAELDAFMTKEDWDLAQETLDTIEKMWPEIARVVQKATGLVPPKIEATPIHTPFGTYRGGYFPVVYDTHIDSRMENVLDNSITPEQMFAKRFTAFVMNNGFTKGRTANVGKLLLSPDIIADHLGEVIHYTTHYEAVKQVDKVLRAPAFKALVKDHLGDDVYKNLKGWLTDVATNTTQKKGWEFGDAFFRWARNSAQLTSLGFNIKSALKQPLGIVTTLDALGTKHWLTGIGAAWTSPKVRENWKFAFANSKELPQLVKNYDRDLAAMSRAYSDKLGHRALEGTYVAAFAPISIMQSVANVAAWHGGFSQAKAQGMSDKEAFDFADKIVRTTQGSGAMKDLAGAQRGGEATKFLTMFYSYFSVLYNRMADVQTRERGLGNLHRKVGRYAVLLLMSELLNTLGDDAWQAMFGPEKKKQEDDTPFLIRLALNTVDSTINTLPGIRDLFTAAEAVIGGSQPRTPPGLNAIQKSVQGAQAIKGLLEGKDLTRNKARNIAALVGTTTNTPVYGIYRLIDDVFGQAMFDE